jgi:stalled ribosome alternative rescue factor ArfA
MFDKKMFKKTGEELQQYLQAMRKHGVKKSKKGKGSYSRKKKHRKSDEE